MKGKLNELALFAGAGGGILGGGYLDGEQSAQLSVMPTPAKFWRNDKTMEFSNLSQFGLTSQLLTESRGQELLTLFLEAFRAKTSAQQEKAQESKASAVECEKKWHGLLAKYDPPTHSWKTAQCSLLEDLELSLQIWPRWGSMRNGACYLQPMLVHHTDESESGYLAETPSGNWPTPTCADVMTDKLKSTQQKPNSMHSVSLAQAVQMWPTPRSCTAMSAPFTENTAKAKFQNLETVVAQRYETPTARMWKDNGTSPSELKRNSETLAMQAGGALNPTWVEWLMGWPLGWTDLKPLGMDRCPCVRPPLSVCC